MLPAIALPASINVPYDAPSPALPPFAPPPPPPLCRYVEGVLPHFATFAESTTEGAAGVAPFAPIPVPPIPPGTSVEEGEVQTEVMQEKVHRTVRL